MTDLSSLTADQLRIEVLRIDSPHVARIEAADEFVRRLKTAEDALEAIKADGLSGRIAKRTAHAALAAIRPNPDA